MPGLNFNAISGELVSDNTPHISIFNSVADFAPRTIPIDSFVDSLKSGTYELKVKEIRATDNEDKQKSIKRMLPCVTISGTFSGGHRLEHMVEHSGLICLDFDADENPCLKTDLEAHKVRVSKDQFSLYTFVSVRGGGLAVICKIEPDKHLEAFYSMTEYYRANYNLVADKACKDACRLRFISYDPTLMHNPNARTFKRYSLAPELELPKQEAKPAPMPMLTGREPLTPETIPPTRYQELKAALWVVSPDDRDTWIKIGQAIHSECPNDDGFNLWDQWSKERDTAGKYSEKAARTAWRSFRPGRINIETLFHYANQHAWEAPQAAPVAPKAPKDEIGVICGAEWVKTPEAPREAVFGNLIDRGDMLEIIAPSKTKKSFFALHTGLCVSAGLDLFCWGVEKPRRVLYGNFEVKPDWMHRRFLRMVEALKLPPETLSNIFFMNTRGQKFEQPIDAVADTVRRVEPEVVILDPLYMLHDGDENTAHEMKPLVRNFMALMAESNAALITVHHDAKGVAGDRDIRDRGAGSSIFGRAVDSRITLTKHADSDDLICIDTMTRNFKPIDGFVCSFENYRFKSENKTYEPETQKTKNRKRIDVSDITTQVAERLREMQIMSVGRLRDLIRDAGATNSNLQSQIIDDIKNLEWVDFTDRKHERGTYNVGTKEAIARHEGR